MSENQKNNNSQLDNVNWGAYFLNKGRKLMEIESKNKKGLFADFEKKNWTKKIYYSISLSLFFGLVISFISFYIYGSLKSWFDYGDYFPLAMIASILGSFVGILFVLFFPKDSGHL